MGQVDGTSNSRGYQHSMSVIADPDYIYIMFNEAEIDIHQALNEIAAQIVCEWHKESPYAEWRWCICLKPPKPSKAKWLKDKLAEIGNREEDEIVWAESNAESL